MSATTPTAPGTFDVSGTRKTPFLRLVSVELRKMVDTRAGMWLMIVIGALTALFVALLFVFGDNGSTDQRTFINYLGTTSTPQGFLLPVMGILLVTSEWTQRTALVTFTLTPHRGSVISAKTVAALVIGLVAIALGLALAAGAATVGDAPGAWDGVEASDFGAFALLQVLGVLQGIGFGLLFLNSAIAIVVFFAAPIAVNLLVSFIEWLRDAAPWIDLSTAQGPLLGIDTTTGQAVDGGMSGEAWAQLATASFIWIIVPIAIGTWRVLRSEMK